jgi:hypothetical protein
MINLNFELNQNGGNGKIHNLVKLGNDCTGIYIGNGIILTAAHCGYQPDERNDRKITKIITFPYCDQISKKKYTGNFFVNDKYNSNCPWCDFALIKLTSEISEIEKCIKKVHILENPEDIPFSDYETELTLYHWGQTSKIIYELIPGKNIDSTIYKWCPEKPYGKKPSRSIIEDIIYRHGPLGKRNQLNIHLDIFNDISKENKYELPVDNEIFYGPLNDDLKHKWTAVKNILTLELRKTTTPIAIGSIIRTSPGDSGGPLYFLKDEKIILIGVLMGTGGGFANTVTTGTGANSVTEGAIFSNAGFYLDFIKKYYNDVNTYTYPNLIHIIRRCNNNTLGNHYYP